MAMCAVETGAVAASARGGRGGGTAAPSAGAAPKANGARAAKMGGGKVATPGKSTTGTAGAKTTTGTSSAKPSAGKANGARAAATKKAINMGTKVSTAIENTTISTECQNAYYGCMDAFCMMDNGSGGRCQCNDRITELDKILDEIMKLDEKSMNLATQGVEKVQMGELASQIDARAKSLEKEFLSDEEKKQQAAAQPKKRELDLSAWNNSSLFDDDDDVFGDKEQDGFQIADDLANKKGDELHKAAAKICTQQIPAQCKTAAAMLQQTYAQKIRSDCTGYENALKQQRTASAQKLQTAQKAVREALLDEEKNKNKYEDLGSCVIAFKQCMQTTGECGADFSGCVADTSILSALYGKAKGAKNGKVATTQIKTGATTVTISSATYDILQNKAMRCESVVRQCQNANGGVTIAGGKVLGEFMKDVALTVYNTEYKMASDSRMNCMTTIINCVKKSCKSAGMDEGTDNYVACLSNPDSIKNYCSLEIKRCGDVGSESDVIAYVQAKLAADRVDKCTEEIKACLTSEDRCGEDYVGCVGLDTDTIMDLCPPQKLMACQEKHNNDAQKVRQYVAQVAQGLALNIDNSFAEKCQEAAEASMVKVCGDKESCAGFSFDSSVGAAPLSYRVCPMVMDPESHVYVMNIDKAACKDSADLISKEEFGLDKLTASSVTQLSSYEYGHSSSAWGFLFFGGGSSATQSKFRYVTTSRYNLIRSERKMWAPYLAGVVNWGATITTGEDENGTLIFKSSIKEPVKNENGEVDPDEKATYDSVQAIVTSLNNGLRTIMSAIESDQTVEQCMRGRTFQGISSSDNITDEKGNIIGMSKGKNSTMKRGGRDSLGEGDGVGRFKNLTTSLRHIVASQVYNSAMNNYNEKLSEFRTKYDEDAEKIATKYEEVLNANNETALNQRLQRQCSAQNRDNSTWNYKEIITAEYDESTHKCNKTMTTQTCKKTTNEGDPGRRTCREWNEKKVSSY